MAKGVCDNLRKICTFIKDYLPGKPHIMATIDKIRNKVIDKILSIRNKEFLEALDKLISFSASESDVVKLTDEQKEMLQMSEEDIKYGRLISQDVMDKRNLEWLDGE